MVLDSIYSWSRWIRFALFGSLLIGALLSGCNLSDGTGGSAGSGNTLATAAVITNTTFTDGSGKIRIRVKTCDPTAAATTNCAYCTADDGWARIGGGAQILGENVPGAMLQSSFPSPNSFDVVNAFGCTGIASPGFDRTWVARASGATHQLQAYVIEMQLIDDNGGSFVPGVTIGIDNVTSAVNPPSNYSVLSPPVPFEEAGTFILVGGGAQVFTTVPSNSITAPTDAYLVESRPVNTPDGHFWKAGARSRHFPAADEPLKAYAIGVETCPSQWGGRCFTYPMIKEITAASTTGYGTAAFSVSPSWVSSSPGGFAPTTNSGARYLADLIPFNGTAKGFTVRSKGAGTGGAGPTFGSTLVFGQNLGLYNFNTVFFNRGGNPAIMTRPGGTNPQLQAGFSSADQPATRWHLEPFGTGTYRLRNGNPDGGTECAYRDGTTSNVRIKTCGTGNEFRWAFFSGLPTGQTLFQLKNSTNGQCLDVNGTATPTNLVLKTCIGSGDPANQLMYVDHFNWPI